MEQQQQQRKKINYLSWRSPATGKCLPAGIAYFNDEYGEFFLKIDEEPSDKQYFLTPSGTAQGRVNYRMELVIKNKEGKFLKRQRVGEGYKDETTDGNVHIEFGSKYKTLVLALGAT